MCLPALAPIGLALGASGAAAGPVGGLAALTVAQGVASYMGDRKYLKQASGAISASADAQQGVLTEQRN